MDAKLERKLSKWGFRVYFGIVAVVMTFFAWEMVTNTGVAGWLNKVQGDLFMDGGYSPVLTMVLLVLPVQVIAFPAGFLFDYATDQGVFASVLQNSSACSEE